MKTEAPELEVQRLIKFDGEGSLKAYCDLVVDGRFLIKGLRVVNGKNGLFVSMPRQQGKTGKWFDLVSPLSKDTKAEVDRLVLEAYQAADGQAGADSLR